MMKKTLIKINNEKAFSCVCDGFIMGVKRYSFGFGKTYDVSEIKKIVKETKKEVFVSLNRTIYNWELDDYKNVLNELDGLGIKGLIVGDVAALTYDLKTNIILDQTHLNNSSLTINHYYNNGVAGVVLTNDITKDEINLISKNTKALLFKQVFGLPHLSSSARKLISNYMEYFNKDGRSDHYFIRENKKDDYYLVKEEETGTYIFSGKPLNLLRVIDELSVDYLIIDDYMLDGDCLPMVAKAFYERDLSKSEMINEKYGANTGFINVKTMYKVKNNE